MDPITGLSAGRIVVGSLSLLSPSLAARTLGLSATANPQLPVMTRMFGSREIALGAITLASSGAARRSLVQVGVAVDGADAVTGVLGVASGSMPKVAGALLAVVALGAVASGVVALQDS